MRVSCLGWTWSAPRWRNFPRIHGTLGLPWRYSSPLVPFGWLPGQSVEVIQVVDALLPTGETPTGAAIAGACSYVEGWLEENPTVVAGLLLLTDDLPDTAASAGCNATLAEATMSAAECHEGDVPIPTYVIGLGSNLSDLEEIAVAGGTAQLRLVDEDAEQLSTHLAEVVADLGSPCSFALPTPTSDAFDLDRINIGYCDAGGASELIPQVSGPGDCDDAGGWYYSDTNDPVRIATCERTCDLVSVPGAQPYFMVGCETVRP